MDNIKLAVLSMSGTTVDDRRAMETCFFNAGLKTGLKADRETIRQQLGLPVMQVVRNLWAKQLPPEDPAFEQSVANTFHLFSAIAQNHYVLNDVKPMEGAVDTFKWLRAEGIYIALVTGFYRKVAHRILDKLGWSEGLDENFRGSEISIIDLSLTPDEAGGKGNPHPDMVQKAMKELGVEKADQVIRVGDSPYDLQSGKAAGCLMSLAVTNGAHPAETLAGHDNDGLLDHIGQLKEVVTANLAGADVK